RSWQLRARRWRARPAHRSARRTRGGECGGAGLPLGHGTRSARPSGSAFHSGTTLPAST
ncbi:hypothetical protein HMPREF9005_1235, partial [Actinomyces sp. oral taxon 178 str. F0338]